METRIRLVAHGLDLVAAHCWSPGFANPTGMPFSLRFSVPTRSRNPARPSGDPKTLKCAALVRGGTGTFFAPRDGCTIR